MVISLFPKRRRRRRWHGLPIQDISDPPSFSEIQPEVTVHEEKTFAREVSVDVPATPKSRCRRKSTIGTPAMRDLPQNRLAATVYGDLPEDEETSCETPGGTVSPRRTRSIIVTPALPKLSANRVEENVSEDHFETSKSTCGFRGLAANPRTSSSGGQYLGVPETVENPLPRRSSRLLENSSANLSAPLSTTPVLDSSRRSRRVSLSLSKRRSSTLQRGRDRESLLTGRSSALSAGEENSDYHAFVDDVIDAKVARNPTRCSRASMTNPDPYPGALATQQAGAEESHSTEAEEPDVQTMKHETGGRQETSARKTPHRSAPSPIKVTAPGISRTEFKTVKRAKKVKPETKDARTSVTGLDRFIRDARRKKSMCVQIDLDATTAFRSTTLSNSDPENAVFPISNQIIESVSQVPLRAAAEPNTSVTERLALPPLSCVADLNLILPPELLPEEQRLSCGERLSSVPPNDCSEVGACSGRNEDKSRLGIEVKKEGRNSSAVLTGESKTAAPPEQVLSRSTTAGHDLSRAPTLDELPSKAAEDFSRLRTGPTGRMVGSRKSADQPKTSDESPKSKTSSESAKISLKRSASHLMNHSATEYPEDIPTSSRADGAKKSSETLSLKSKGSVSLTSENPRPTISEQEYHLGTPTVAKRSRSAREPRTVRRRSSEIDMLSIARRIKEKIERKRLIENTIYRRVNLIYEGLWEDFLQTYCPEKWRKVKDAWMVGKAKKRLEEEQRGLGDLDDDMEREAQRGTELGAAKYIKEFEKKRAEAERRAQFSGRKSSKSVRQSSLPLEENRRQSRRL